MGWNPGYLLKSFLLYQTRNASSENISPHCAVTTGIFRFTYIRKIIDDYIRRIVNNKVHFSLTFACIFFLFCFATLQYISRFTLCFHDFFFHLQFNFFENNEISQPLGIVSVVEKRVFFLYFLLFISYCRFCWDCQCRKADYYQGRRSQRG